MGEKNIFRVVNRIAKDSKHAEHYYTGLVGEQLIVSAYNTMTVDKLEKLRFILNKIIKKKKEYKRVQQAQK